MSVFINLICHMSFSVKLVQSVAGSKSIVFLNIDYGNVICWWILCSFKVCFLLQSELSHLTSHTVTSLQDSEEEDNQLDASSESSGETEDLSSEGF